MGDLLPVGEIQCTVERDPNALQMHRTYLHHMPHLLTLENPISPTSGHARDIEKFRAIDHMIVCTVLVSQPQTSLGRWSPDGAVQDKLTLSSSHTDALRLDLEAQTALIFPQRRRHSGFHPRRSYLTGRIEWLRRVARTALNRSRAGWRRLGRGCHG